MQRHGDVSLAALSNRTANLVWSAAGSRGTRFRHMLERQYGDGRHAVGGHKRGLLVTALDKLGLALHRNFLDSDPAARRENSRIPAGYTYFWQFVGHDLTRSVMSRDPSNEGSGRLENARTQFLGLQSIYGAGPACAQSLYQSDRPGELAGHSPAADYLRLGPFKAEQAQLTCPFRDLPRANLAGASNAGLPDVLVADGRNDDQTILAQLTAIFHLLHNGIAAKLAAVRPDLAGSSRHEATRLAVLVLYRDAIRHDLLKRLLSPTVHRLYEARKSALIEPFGGAIPLEFSHGAGRVAHTMIRDRYRLRDLEDPFLIDKMLRQTSAMNPKEMPLDTKWIIDWSNFFPIDGDPPAFSMKLGPRYSNRLMSDVLFPPTETIEKGNLAYRDQLSAILTGVWSIPDLIDRISQNADLAPLLDETVSGPDPYFRKQVAGWLEKEKDSGLNFTQLEIDALSQDPPLPFYLMCEAEFHPGVNGFHLGPLGSLIVADTIYGALSETPIVQGELHLNRNQVLANIGGQLGDPALFAWLGPEDGMAGLIKEAASLSGLSGAVPSFL